MVSTRSATPDSDVRVEWVAVVDPRPIVASGLASLLSAGLDGHQVVTAPTGSAAPYEVCVAVVPVPPHLDRIETIELLVAGGHRVITVGPDTLQVAQAAEAGSWGHLPDDGDATELVEGVRRVADGQMLFSREEREALTRTLREGRSAYHSEGMSSLTPREVEVLGELCRGRRPAEIAEDHFVSVRTVRNQVQSILTKLNVHSQLEAVAVASRHPSFNT